MMIAIATSCGGGARDGRTGNAVVDACLHWTACITPSRQPLSFSGCVMGFIDGVGGRLPWRPDSVAVSSAQLSCLADADLDCAKALDCVSSPAPSPCPSPTWSCDGDTLTRCDSFSGSRVVSEDCSSAGLHCVPVGGQASCGLAACDPNASTELCVGASAVGCQAVQDIDGAKIGGIQVVSYDCNASDADCSIDMNGSAQCVGNGPICTPSPGVGPTGCQGDLLITCDSSGHQEQTDCAASGHHCVSFQPDINPAGIEFGCASQASLVICTDDGSFGACKGTTLEYCDDHHGNERLDCKALGYSGCADGHCVP